MNEIRRERMNEWHGGRLGGGRQRDTKNEAKGGKSAMKEEQQQRHHQQRGARRRRSTFNHRHTASLLACLVFLLCFVFTLALFLLSGLGFLSPPTPVSQSDSLRDCPRSLHPPPPTLLISAALLGPFVAVPPSPIWSHLASGAAALARQVRGRVVLGTKVLGVAGLRGRRRSRERARGIQAIARGEGMCNGWRGFGECVSGVCVGATTRRWGFLVVIRAEVRNHG
ncbi:uncharacterized protein [Physcomitrium patens]|uniref:uncharacterized protein n=1 Tax=Physcomitrium patens TaxID=3218 RepID=UPI003CCD591E